MNLRNPDIISHIVSGIAYGDSMGLPWENLKPSSIPKNTHTIGNISNRMISDDTEHALFTLAALYNTNKNEFEPALRERFNRWFSAFPPSLGGATLRSGLLSISGVKRSGVKSQGNGPLIRAAMLGAAVENDILRIPLIDISTNLTHHDPIARACARMTAEYVVARLEKRNVVVEANLGRWVKPMNLALSKASTSDIALACGFNLKNGVSGHAPVTLVMAIHIAEKYANMEEAVTAMISLGGDVDSTAALVGAFLAASGSKPPKNWDLAINDIIWSDIASNILNGGDWPHHIGKIRKRNIHQLVWALQMMFGRKLKIRLFGAKAA